MCDNRPKNKMKIYLHFFISVLIHKFTVPILYKNQVPQQIFENVNKFFKNELIEIDTPEKICFS